MTFRFNFGVEDNASAQNEAIKPSEPSENPIKHEARLINVQEKHLEELSSHVVIETNLQNGNILRHVSRQSAEDGLKASGSSILAAINTHSDLLSGVYEGGLKIWECSIDLLNYMISENLQLKHLQVLELGCGAALPGIYALLQGAYVTFQDYNHEVIDLVTIPNALLNSDKNQIELRTKFISGDWSVIHDTLKQSTDFNEYDVILTSETIYNQNSQGKLLNAMKQLLKPDGIMYPFSDWEKGCPSLA